jgi:hypothetical protein
VVALNPWSGPLREVVLWVGPPLSERKKMIVFSSWPMVRTWSRIRPTASSIADIIITTSGGG